MFDLYRSLGKLSRLQIDIFLIFLQKAGFDMSCELSPLQTICMNRQNLFSGKIKQKRFNMSSAEKFIHSAMRKKQTSISSPSFLCPLVIGPVK